MDKKQHGAHATNQEYAKYDQVHKPQEYRLAEDATKDEFDEDYRVRTCDLRLLLEGSQQDREQFAADLGTAMQELGFTILSNAHSEDALYEEIEDELTNLYTRISLEEKMRFRAQRHGSVSQGYFPVKETSDIHPDLVEGWVFCRRAFNIKQRDGLLPASHQDFWPDPNQEPVFRRLVSENEKLILPLMQSMLTYLDHDPHLYDERLTRTNIGLRLNYYPAMPEETPSGSAGRLLGHEDVGMFVLLPAPRVEGLQALNRQNDKWVRLQAPPGSLILNTGDYMQRISNDIFPSTTHRVSRPRHPNQAAATRVSFPMAVYIWEEEMLEVLPNLADPKYEPISAIAFHTHSTAKFYGDDYAVEA